MTFIHLLIILGILIVIGIVAFWLLEIINDYRFKKWYRNRMERLNYDMEDYIDLLRKYQKKVGICKGRNISDE